jgi:hypothetical protein
MSFGAKPERWGQGAGCLNGACPACGVELDARATPANSIVICARCCAALLWDGTFSAVTAEQLENLCEPDRRRLQVLVAAQRARNAAQRAN